MRRVPTLKSYFQKPNRPVKILKNFIFLVIHDTKAALYFSGNPVWQNTSKTCFSEQKISFSLYHLHRLGHPARGKTSFISHCRRQTSQIIIFLVKRFRAFRGPEKIRPFSGLFPVKEVAVFHLFPAHCYSSKGWRRRVRDTAEEGREGPQQLTALEPCLCSRDPACHCHACHFIPDQESQDTLNAAMLHWTPFTPLRLWFGSKADCKRAPNSPPGFDPLSSSEGEKSPSLHFPPYHRAVHH